MSAINTEKLPILGTNAGSNGVFNPLTGPIDTTDLKWIRANWWLESRNANLSVRPGLQFSDDGQNWDTAIAWGAAALSVLGGELFGQVDPLWCFGLEFDRVGD